VSDRIETEETEKWKEIKSQMQIHESISVNFYANRPTWTIDQASGSRFPHHTTFPGSVELVPGGLSVMAQHEQLF
jgi:hypothetical protein